jgi:hypothetical protein
VTRAAAKHRQMDAALAERLAQDGDQGCRTGTLVPGHGGGRENSDNVTISLVTVPCSFLVVFVQRICVR